jgi:hypothetical protein
MTDSVAGYKLYRLINHFKYCIAIIYINVLLKELYLKMYKCTKPRDCLMYMCTLFLSMLAQNYCKIFLVSAIYP